LHDRIVAPRAGALWPGGFSGNLILVKFIFRFAL
jgi:hypothetical protein